MSDLDLRVLEKRLLRTIVLDRRTVGRGAMTSGGQPEDPFAPNGSEVEPVPLLDLSAVALTELPSMESPVLADCIKRLQREVADSEAATAGFNSAV